MLDLMTELFQVARVLHNIMGSESLGVKGQLGLLATGQFPLIPAAGFTETLHSQLRRRVDKDYHIALSIQPCFHEEGSVDHKSLDRGRRCRPLIHTLRLDQRMHEPLKSTTLRIISEHD